MNKIAKIVTACVALGCAAGLGVAAYTLHEEGENGSPLPVPEQVEVTEAPTEPPTMPLYDEFSEAPSGLTEKAKIMLKKNKDYAGWIKIENTYVDYPFLKDPGEISEGQPYYLNQFWNPNYFYLHKDFDRNEDFGGSLFMDYRDDFGSMEYLQSDNIIIYGHNMLNLTMFGSIRHYYNNYSFWETAPFIELSSKYRDYDYVVCGNCVTSGYKESDFVYWDMEELDTQEDFDFFAGKLKEKQLFDTGVDMKFGDKLLTLSTCYGASEDNRRFILVARRLREGEKAGDMSTIERTEEYIQKQKEKEENEKQKEKENN